MIRHATPIFGAVLLASASLLTAAEKLEYNRDIRPILSEHCFACHGPDSASRKADLRLDKRENAIDAGAIVVGSPADSELISRISTDDAELIMPPPAVKKELTAAQKDTLRRWVQEGAEYQPHWSLIAPKRPELPKVKNAKWARTPIDLFVLAELEKQGLAPAPEADRRTLARRLSLDLTGLPPKPEAVEAFVNDKSKNAYEKYVDKLLASPHYGEHRGRYWLDAARYADTHGIHFDNFREMWSYRDWVIAAFNANQPFDQFTIEQLAGDLLPDRTQAQQIASGFNRCNMTTNEGGIIDEEYLVLYARDRTETTSTVFMGLTAGCAVCHDHKFDPISQREFYEMAAFFNNTTQAAKDGNIKDTPPILNVPQPKDRARFAAIGGKIEEAQERTEDRKETSRAKFDAWLADEAKPDAVAARAPSDSLQFYAPLNEAKGETLHTKVKGEDRDIALGGPLANEAGFVAPKAYKVEGKQFPKAPDVGDFERDQPFTVAAWVKIPKDHAGGAILGRMGEGPVYRGWDLYYERGKLGTHFIHEWPNEAFKIVTRKAIRADAWNHVMLAYDGSGKSGGVKLYVNGVVQDLIAPTKTLPATIRTDAPFTIGQRSVGSRIEGLLISDVRLYDRLLSADELTLVSQTARVARTLSKTPEKMTEAEKTAAFDWWLLAMDDVYPKLSGRLRALQAERDAIRARGTIAHVMQEREQPAMAYVLYRGEYDKRRDEVPASTPDALPPMPEDLPRNRLGFAQWLLREEHPLTSRVTVNRFWQEVFGTGLVRTAGDFGVTGELPSNAALLDWLAVEFRENDWDVKQFFKMLVTSAAYRQAAITTPEKLERDPQNRLLSRGPRFRMDAEMVRDYALASSGLLVEKIGGPSVKPYQPPGVWEAVAMTASNTRFYQPDEGENLYRRSMYTFWKRAAPPASMDIFNAPSREVCTVRRDRTNTPLQALVTMNDPQFVESARHLAETVLKKHADTESRLDELARRLLSRPLRTEERVIAQATLLDFMSYYHSHTEDATKLLAVGESKRDESLNAGEVAAWTMLGNELMNLDEVLCK
jgi:hypothetical protein